MALLEVNPGAHKETFAPPAASECVPACYLLVGRHRYERRLTSSDDVSEHVLVGLQLQHLGRHPTEGEERKRGEAVNRGVAVRANAVSSDRVQPFQGVAAIEPDNGSKALR